MAQREASAVQRGDWLIACLWVMAAWLARWPLVARAEGLLDHDQAVVGLMALDISQGKRLPIFFDGQRYMGAIEGHLAGLFVRWFGHAPSVVALAPLLLFGVFVGSQYLVWRTWRDRETGILAALFTLIGGPMLVAWGTVPRGGYIELLAWALPTLHIYRRVTRPGAQPFSAGKQAGWGAFLALGHFINPLAMIVYLTLAIDWTLGRHGADVRARWDAAGPTWLDRPWAPLVWLGLVCVLVLFVGACVHVNFDHSLGEVGMIYGMGRLPRPVAALGAAGAILGVVWATGAASRLYKLLVSSPAFSLGAMAGQVPMLIYQTRTALGWAPRDPSLTSWVRAPWRVDFSPSHMARVLDFVVGSRPRAALSPLFGQAVPFPDPADDLLEAALDAFSPLVMLVVLTLIATLVWRDRYSWRRLWSLRGRVPTRPTVLAVLLLIVALGMFRLQGSSFDGSSIRYLLPIWVVVPGLIACGLMRLPMVARWFAVLVLLAGWGLVQVDLLAAADRPCPYRPLVRELERHRIQGVVAQTPAALMVADLSHGRIGAMMYQADWPRLGVRYADRVPERGPVFCVVDRDFPWPTPEHPGWTPSQDLGRHLRWLDQRFPGRLRKIAQVDSFDVWEVNLPRIVVLAAPESLAEGPSSR